MQVVETIHMKSGGQQTIVTPFNDYCDHVKVAVFKVLGDIESVCEQMTGQSRADWTEEEANAYDRIRTQLLNVAGSIAR